jgi:hypothetical protein
LFTSKRSAIEEIYKLEAAKIAQNPAPHYFQIEKGVIDAQFPESDDLKPSGRETLDALTDQARDLLAALHNTNSDPRLLIVVQRYIEALDPSSFSSVRLELFANNIRGLLHTFKDELSGPAIVSATALMLSHEQSMRQFPQWREFVEQGPIRVLSKDKLDQHNRTIIELLISPGADLSLAISAKAKAAALEIDQLSQNQNPKSGEYDATVRAITNFIKANVAYVLKQVKNGYVGGSSIIQKLYFSLFMKFLPHFKLFSSYVPELTWLVPILDYIQDLTPKHENSPKKKTKSRAKQLTKS